MYNHCHPKLQKPLPKSSLFERKYTYNESENDDLIDGNAEDTI